LVLGGTARFTLALSSPAASVFAPPFLTAAAGLHVGQRVNNGSNILRGMGRV
jgi:hypothetical protein